MKISTFLILLFFSIFLFSQNYLDIVYLKNGNKLTGFILEQIPNEKLKIETIDGSVFVLKYSEIVKITKEIQNSSSINNNTNEDNSDVLDKSKNKSNKFDETQINKENINNQSDDEKKKSRKELKKEHAEEIEIKKEKLNETLAKAQVAPTGTTSSNKSNSEKKEDESFIVGIFPFKGTVPKYVKDLESQTIQSFSQKSRFTVVDRTNVEITKKEKELQKSEDYLNGYVVDQGKNIGAKYIVTGELYNIGVTSQNFKRTDYTTKQIYYETKYSAYLTFNLTLLDIETGQIKSNNNFTIKTTNVGWAGFLSSSAGYFNTESEALNRAMLSANGYIKGWINSIFPVKMKILKVEETDKKGNPVIILIKGGADTDLRKGSDLNVIYPEILIVEGKEYTKPTQIGTIKVLEVEGEFSTCKIKSGNDKIQEILNEGKTLTLSIKSYK